MEDEDMGGDLQSCLASLGVSAETLEVCGSDVDEEFKAIKKAYFKRILETHPDKGGDAAAFRTVQVAFEVVRNLFTSGSVVSFSSSSARSTASDYEEFMARYGASSTASYEFYEAAAEEEMPAYRVERAKSGRSGCAQKGAAKKCGDDKLIALGALRVGSLDDANGGYGRWNHLACWRVPSKVWLGLPDADDAARVEAALLSMTDVLLVGVGELAPAERLAFVRHCMDRDNWARLTKPRNPAAGASTHQAAAASAEPAAAVSASAQSRALVAASGPVRFVAPVPGQGGCAAGSLAGQIFVLTGLFPELGGGGGLNLGKDRAKALIESFGGKVTGSVSGRTTALLVGKAPGMSKVSQARAKSEVKLMSLHDLKQSLEGRLLEGPAPMQITSFSAGYGSRAGYNGLANTASLAELEYASGHTQQLPADAKPAAAKKFSAPKKKRVSPPPPDDDDDDDEDDELDEKPAAKKRAPAKKPAARAFRPVATKPAPKPKPALAIQAGPVGTRRSTRVRKPISYDQDSPDESHD